jgi:hypothetical protein
MSFFILTKRDFILSAAERWEMLHSEKQKTKRELDTLTALRRMNLATATEDDVARVVGHRGLTGLVCDVCHGEIEAALVYEDRNAEPHSFCQDCLAHAAKLFGNMLQEQEMFAAMQRRPKLSLVEG